MPGLRVLVDFIFFPHNWQIYLSGHKITTSNRKIQSRQNSVCWALVCVPGEVIAKQNFQNSAVPGVFSFQWDTKPPGMKCDSFSSPTSFPLHSGEPRNIWEGSGQVSREFSPCPFTSAGKDRTSPIQAQCVYENRMGKELETPEETLLPLGSLVSISETVQQTFYFFYLIHN